MRDLSLISSNWILFSTGEEIFWHSHTPMETKTQQETTTQSSRETETAASVAFIDVSNQTLRLTRQRARQANNVTRDSTSISSEVPAHTAPNQAAGNVPVNSSCHASTMTLPAILTSVTTDLNHPDLVRLTSKQQLLRQSKFQAWLRSPVSKAKLASAARATLVFAQKEAGTAVCISPSGLLLTCSHCVAETPQERDQPQNKSKWLLFASGQVVRAKCIAWDPKRDLALLQVTAAQSERRLTDPNGLESSENGVGIEFSPFPFVTIAEAPPPLRRALICIGHPGSEDLEASTPGVQTDYDALHVSTGLFRGYAPGQDLQDNSEIGALKHDCWTYWGHSGAPLVEQTTGRLVGLHSSWDETTGIRRGVPLEAIRQFLQQQTEHSTSG